MFNSAQISPPSARLRLRYLFVFLLTICPAVLPAKTVKLSGTVFTLGPDQLQTVWPNAKITLKNLASNQQLSTISNDLGQYSFVGVLPGDCEIAVTLAGFQPLTKRIVLDPDKPNLLDLQLTPEQHTESVTVSASSNSVDVSSSTSASPTLTTNVLKSLVRLNSDFQDALPLLPSVVRGPDGLIHVKGGQANQTSALVNNASIADPFTGQPALRLPTAAVESMRVLSNPFSAVYGSFSSGVIEVTTRGGTDDWKFLFEDPIPRLRWIDYSTHGLESLTPHLAFSGPILRDKLFIFQSLYLGYDLTRVPSLPNPRNERVDERLNSHTQLDWDISPNHRLTFMLTVDPQNTNFANIDTFNPQPVTADSRQRDFFASANEHWIFPNGGYLASLFSVKRLNTEIFPADSISGAMTLFPEQNSGSFFNTQSRHTFLYQWSQTLHLRPLEFHGRHLFTFGYSFVRSTYQGFFADLPINILREDHTLSSRITYADPLLPSAAATNNFTFFIQDSWQIYPRLILDFGLRLDHDSFSTDSVNVAPRFGFVYAPSADNRTAIRGGAGLFYDKIPINIAVFPDLPAQTITQFAADGTSILGEPTTFAHTIATRNGTLTVPYSFGATLQFDRELRKDLLFRFGAELRNGFHEFFLNPSQSAGQPAQLGLYNSGRQTYREFLFMLRWQPLENTTLMASYVRSRAWGQLNDYNQFFGDFSYPLIRANQYGPLPHDAPNRVLFWGIIQLPKKFQFVPILDVHSGFPYSAVATNWDYVGLRDQAGRFPTFLGLDAKIQYPFDLKFRGHRIQFLGGLKVSNLLNHFQPRDVQQYIGSPFYGTFYNSVGRLWRIDGDFDF
jgi:Carboxypeptidase regulatory-like domain/TonB dependent receptor-like, beta-barrel